MAKRTTRRDAGSTEPGVRKAAGKSGSRRTRRRPITPEDLCKFRLVGSPRISPDAARIVFVEKHVGKKNEYITNLWIAPTGAGEPVKFTDGSRDRAPAWSPDGSRIAFVRAEEKHRPQVFIIRAAGGEATATTDFPEGAIGAVRWSPDGKRLAVSFREQDPLFSKDAKKDRKEQGLSTPPRVVDDLWYRLDGDGYFGAQRHHLYLVDVESGKAKKIYAKDNMGSFTFDFSPNSKELVVSTNRDKMAMIRPWKDELLRIDVASGKAVRIANLPEGPKTCVAWSPDGKRIAYAGRIGRDDTYSTENLELFVCDPRRGGAKSLTGQTDYCLLSVSIGDAAEAEFQPAFEFSPDGSRIYMQLGIQGEVHVASVPTAGGPVSIHTQGPIDLAMGNLSRDGTKMALTVAGTTQLAEVFVADCRTRRLKMTRLTDLNGPLLKQLDLAEPQSHWVEAPDGHKVQVWVIQPPRMRRGKKVPAVLEIHGGPHAQYGSGFFHEFQVLAASGYAVFYSNPRGSKGYGRDHCAAIRGDWGSADWQDIQAVTRFMQSCRFVDTARLGVMGGSYGGYMTNWAIGHTRDFAAAISDRCVSNLVSFSGNSDYAEAPDHYFPGNFWDRPEKRWEQSPVKYLGDAKTPTLIIHSEGDLRCNIEQSEQVFTALKLLGVPTRLVRYPSSTSHGMSRQGPPDLRIHRLRQILAWWEEYLRVVS